MIEPVFSAVPAVDAGILQQLARRTPWSPFNTAAYAAAAARLQMAPYALLTTADDGIVDGCLGLLAPSSGMRKLTLPSLPALRDAEAFWAGVVRFCAGQGVTDLIVDTFASDGASLPRLPRRSQYRTRSEYVIDLDAEFENRIAKNHKYSARKAKRSGIVFSRTRDVAACETHISLMRASTDRRAARGETVTAPGESALHAAILGAGAGELFQAVLDGRALSSILVLRGEASAYYHSGGTGPEGMKLGASQFVLLETARQLRSEGIGLFNLGGADAAAEGMRTFKQRFGTREVPLAAATYYLVPEYKRTALRLVRRLQRVPRKLRKLAP